MNNKNQSVLWIENRGQNWKKNLSKTLQLLGTKKNTGKMHSNAIGCISDHVPFIYHFGHEMWWIKLTRRLYGTQFGEIFTIENKYITKTVYLILLENLQIKETVDVLSEI